MYLSKQYFKQYHINSVVPRPDFTRFTFNKGDKSAGVLTIGSKTFLRIICTTEHLPLMMEYAANNYSQLLIYWDKYE